MEVVMQRLVIALFALCGSLLLPGLAGTAARGDIDAKMQTLVRRSDVGKTVVALYAVDLTAGLVLVKQNADEPMIPASNLKLVTTAAALHTLGADFVFETKLILQNPPKAAGGAAGAGAAGAVGGNAPQTDAVLVVRGDGDPSFGDEAILRVHGGAVGDVEALLQLWVDAVKKANIKKVARIILDDGVFDQTFTHPSWPADQLNRWYCAQVAGINFFTNCLDVYPTPTAGASETPLVKIVPEAPFIPATNLATTGSTDTFWISRKIDSNEITFRGTVKHKRIKPVNVTIHDPPIFFGQVLADRLRRAGIAVDEVGRPTLRDVLIDGKPLHVIRTPLPLALQRCNKNSQNLYAEALFKRVGRKVTGAPGSFENGAAAVRLFLQKQIGTAAASVNTADGSGLSRDNRVTAHIMVDVLSAMHKDPKAGKIFRQSLSIAGKDGTLDDRLTGLKNRVYGKTGYINGVSCLTGYLVVPKPTAAANTAAGATATDDADDARVIAFSFLFNDLKAPLDVVMRLQDGLVKMIDEAYAK